jgi:uncharacterized protein YbjT (DUF2867 family)
MNNSGQVTLVLGGTGRTGALVARKLAERGVRTRTAARHGADVPFDWDNPATHRLVLAGADRIYLVTPVLRVSYARLVSGFLDLAEASGIRHITYLSAYGSDHAPPQVDIRAVELDLMSRRTFTSSVLRPAWVMQNFTDQHLPVIQDMITVPTAGGAEAFVDAADIAAVAVETLADPDAHAGAMYAPTGPEALTVAEVADIIAGVAGRPVRHNDIDRGAWTDAAIAAGAVPASYRVMLDWLTATVASGHGSRPNDDVLRITGSPPASFADFACRNARAWALPAARP